MSKWCQRNICPFGKLLNARSPDFEPDFVIMTDSNWHHEDVEDQRKVVLNRKPNSKVANCHLNGF